MVPYEADEGKIWPLLRPTVEWGEPDEVGRFDEDPVRFSSPNSFVADETRVMRLARRVVRGGKEWVSGQNMLAACQSAESIELDVQRIGQMMAALRTPNRRVRMGGRQVRVYRVDSGQVSRQGPAQ
jgi:hypothetical protein